MIRIQNLTKRFGDRVAVDNLDLEIESGETLGVVGPNGAGKTTIFKVLATLAKPDGGQVWLGGLDVVEQVAQVRRRIGYMPDAFGAYDLFSASEYLDYFAAAYGLRGQARVAAIRGVMDLCDLGPVRDEAVGFLSRGIRQRLLLAKTLLHDPDVLILDEPASGLDPRARIEIRAVLLELKKMGKTILISSHILSELAQLSTRVALMEKGKLLAVGGLADLHGMITTGRMIRLVPRKETDRAEEVVRSSGLAKEIFREGDELLIVTEDGEGDPDRLLTLLLEAKIGIQSYAEEEPDLERIFLRLTRGDIQ
ncbi:MAG: ABC transporter ATP-binding protein [Planctomycetota bacterium]|nr:ABC transporter ATP-binding protein [Planctomycetota bacterium]